MKNQANKKPLSKLQTEVLYVLSILPRQWQTENQISELIEADFEKPESGELKEAIGLLMKRRLIFYTGYTGEYILTATGLNLCRFSNLGSPYYNSVSKNVQHSEFRTATA